jgi:hypothetical protein
LSRAEKSEINSEDRCTIRKINKNILIKIICIILLYVAAGLIQTYGMMKWETYIDYKIIVFLSIIPIVAVDFLIIKILPAKHKFIRSLF